MKKQSIQNYLKSNRVINSINLTLTEKQIVNGKRIDGISSSQNFRHFKNLLNSKIYGKRYRRFDVQLKMVVVDEVSHNGRHHKHCIIEVPKGWDANDFVLLIHKFWKQTDYGHKQIHFEKPMNEQREVGWLNYILKHSTKNEGLENAVDWANCYL